jgi:hypothetical protein
LLRAYGATERAAHLAGQLHYELDEIECVFDRPGDVLEVAATALLMTMMMLRPARSGGRGVRCATTHFIPQQPGRRFALSCAATGCVNLSTHLTQWLCS